MLKRATGEALDELTSKVLFGPLGITDVAWHKDARNNPIAAGGLRMRPARAVRSWRDRALVGVGSACTSPRRSTLWSS